MPIRRTLVTLALLVVCASEVRAQVAGGTIRGTVTDQQGQIVPGVVVALQGTDISRTIISDAVGQYRFLDLAPGSYRLTVALQGFSTIVRDHVNVDVGKTVELPMQVKVGEVSDTLTVSAASPIVDRRETGTITNVTGDELENIPTSRDPFALMRSVPGVLVDRVNVGGNETGQQSNFVSKGTRPQDAVWAMDGVLITDMTLTGTSPTYFNHDNFEQVQIATAGQPITQPTGGVGFNLVVKRGTNQFHGSARGYFDNQALEASNVPAELIALNVTPATADHNKQISDYGGEIGGPIVPNRAWFYSSYSIQDIRLVRRAGNLIDRTTLKNPDVKVNWQATPKDLVNFLYFNGYKVKDYRSPGTTGILFDAPTATFHQDNAYTSNPLHGLFKIGDDRIINSKIFLSAKYAYYNTGFVLEPEGGMNLQAGRDLTTSRSFGSTSRSVNIRPQTTLNIDLSSFLSTSRATHDLRYGFAWRRVDATTGTEWPGNGILALQNSPTAFFAEIFRQGLGTNRAYYTDFFVGDSMALSRMTIDLGLRYDRQSGRALPSVTQANPAFPTLVPGLNFTGARRDDLRAGRRAPNDSARELQSVRRPAGHGWHRVRESELVGGRGRLSVGGR